jgi:hypothetical protein
MTCEFCTIVEQYALNWLNLIDHLGNTLLFGDANETISARTGRARNADSKVAKVFCWVLTKAAYLVTFGKVNRDHCTYALDKSVLPNSREIWNWNTGKFRSVPKTMIDDIELDDTDSLKNNNQ